MAAWIRVLVCSGPRQAINGLTLYSVYKEKLQIQGSDFETSLSSFFDKIRALATEEPRQAVILSGMIFTFVIWIFSFLSLLLAALFFVLYLWSYIPRQDGGLTGFCERKVNKRLKQIVSIKINKAMAEEERKRRKAEFKAAMKNGEERPVTMQPSLPVLSDDSLPKMPSIQRADTFASLSEKPSRSDSSGSFEMNALGQKPTRSATFATSASQFSSKSSLVGGAAEMGISRSESPIPTLPPVDLEGYSPLRSATGPPNASFGTGRGPQRMASNGASLGAGYTASPATYSSETMPSLPPPVRSPVNIPNGYRGPGPNQGRDRWPGSGEMRSPFDDRSSGRGSPAPSMTSYRSNPMSPRGMGPDGYPIRSATNPVPQRSPPQFPPPRNMTAPMRTFHQPTGSNGSLRSMPSAGQPYHQQSPSNSSLRNVIVPAGTYPQAQDGGEYEYASRPYPMPTDNPRGPPRGFGSGWNQDLERGGDPRF